MNWLKCLFGFHSWREVQNRLAYKDDRCEVMHIKQACIHCSKTREWYDDDE